MTAPRPETLALQAEWAARNARRQAPMVQKADPVLDLIEKATPFLDDGWSGPGRLKPSSVIMITYCMIMTSSAADAAERAFTLTMQRMLEARRRFRAGFYANPFGDPVERPFEASLAAPRQTLPAPTLPNEGNSAP